MTISLSDALGLCGVAINAIVLVFLVVQVWLLRAQVNQAKDAFVKEQVLSRKQSTLEFMANTVGRRHELAALIPSEEEHSKVRELLRGFDDSSTTRRNLYDYLNYYEMLATGANADVLDIDMVNRNTGGVIIKIFRTYAALIFRLRREQQRPTMYEELQVLATRLSAMRGLPLPPSAEDQPA
jgi:hypothetical protein